MHGNWTRVARWKGMVVLSIAAGLALTGDASSDPITAGNGGRVSVAAPMLTLRPGHAMRLTAVEVDAGGPARQVRMSVFDGQRRLVRESNEVASPTRAVFLDVVKPPPGGGDPTPLPIRAEFEFDCEDDLDSGLLTSIEVFNTVTGNIETTSACGCPCCGPPLPPGVAADCGGGWRAAGSLAAP